MLEPRPEQTTTFGHAARAAVREPAVGEDRAPIRAFSVWLVQHDLARRERHGRATGNSAGNSLRLVRAAVELSVWAVAHGLTLAQLRQEHLDRWLEEGSSSTVSIRPFLSWAARAGLTAPLDAGRRPAYAQTEPISNEERLTVVRRLLHD